MNVYKMATALGQIQAPARNQNPLLLDAALRPNAATPIHMILAKIPCTPVNMSSEVEILCLSSGGTVALVAGFRIFPPAQVRTFQIRSGADSCPNRRLCVELCRSRTERPWAH